MLSIQQHLVQNEKYKAQGTTRCALVQVKIANKWLDYARDEIEAAKRYVNNKLKTEPGEWRVVDWISKEEINLADTASITELLNTNPWDEKLDATEAQLDYIVALCERAKRNHKNNRPANVKLNLINIVSSANQLLEEKS